MFTADDACPPEVCGTCKERKGPDFNHPNQYAELADEDEEGDEEHMSESLKQFAHVVHSGPKLSQKESRRVIGKGAPPASTKKQIASIVHKIATGEISLPELDTRVKSDEDLVAIWALLDAGSAVHVADFSKHFPGLKTKEGNSKKRGVKYHTAGGGLPPNRGEGDLVFKTTEGNYGSITFQDAAVGMPIISTNGLAREGNDITYRAEDGYAHHLKTNERTYFIAKDNVYFIQLLVPKSAVKSPDPDFGRHA